MPERRWQALNLLQIFDVLRGASLARLAVVADGKPYMVPVSYQLEVERTNTIVHITMLAQGKKITALRRCDLVCLEFELPGCAWLDTVVIQGRASIGVQDPQGRALDVRVSAGEMTGRRYFDTG